MASPKKQTPLTIDDLIDAQKSMMKRADVTEQQIKLAQQQLEKLEAIRDTEAMANVEMVKEDQDINRITKKKGDSNHVSLGDLQSEVKGLRKDLTGAGTAPKDGRSPLPLMTIGGEAAGAAAEGETKEQRRERLERIGSAIGSQQQTLYGDVNKQTAQAKNTETYDKFIRETGAKNELMASATEDQKKIFERLEETMVKLREDDGKNSEALRQEISKLGSELGGTEDTKFKDKVSGIIGNAGQTARIGARGDKGNLGDALRVAMGKQEVLKQGYEFDPRLQGKKGHMWGVRHTESGHTAAIDDTKMGKFAGAATIAGNFFKGKVEQFNNQYKSDAIPNFLDNNVRSGSTGRERAAGFAATKEQLLRGPSASTTSGKVSPAAIMSQAVTAPAAVASMAAPVSQMSSAKVINLTAETVNLAGGSAAGAGSAPAAEGGSSLGDMASSAMDMGKSGVAKAGGWLSSAAGAGKNLIGKIPGGALKGGIAALGGAALSYGGDKLKEAGYEKTGAAADVAGTAASWGGTGAMIGSVVPGVGTAIGAGVGAVAGGAYGLYKNWGSMFGGDKEAPNAATGVAAGAQTQQLGPEAAGAFRKQNQAKFEAMKARQNNLEQLSAQNSAAKSAAPAPVVINNTAGQAAAQAPVQNMMLPRGNVRPQESAVEKYSGRQAAFY